MFVRKDDDLGPRRIALRVEYPGKSHPGVAFKLKFFASFSCSGLARCFRFVAQQCLISFHTRDAPGKLRENAKRTIQGVQKLLPDAAVIICSGYLLLPQHAAEQFTIHALLRRLAFQLPSPNTVSYCSI